ncbi:aminotransferase class III-fold pyridoxal phosphate-dependent enzyme, partial [Candidatus Dependentiae bacterium]|nr:aminotransferase class III-fold pyridoxal phosphate-dependent enzyme [Candidatus Dependentiae bacterium]
SYGGAQELYGIKPDLTVLGKIIGGGMPVGAYGGTKEIMELISPLGPVYQAGTLSGNPISVAAGIKTLQLLKNSDIYESLERTAAKFESGLTEILTKFSISHKINRIGSMMTVFFTESDVFDYISALKSDVNKYSKFFHLLLDRGIYFPPSQFESMFISAAHKDSDIDLTLISIENALSNFNK